MFDSELGRKVTQEPQFLRVDNDDFKEPNKIMPFMRARTEAKETQFKLRKSMNLID